MNIIEFNNFLNDELYYKVIEQTLNSSKWKFGHLSIETGLKFWQIELLDNSLFINEIFGLIKEKTKLNFELVNVYANGQTHGLCGSPHKDSASNNYKTFLIYVNPIWDISWGGYTFFYNDELNEIKNIYPAPNKAILFDANILHFGMDPTRHCKELRVTVAYKLKLK